MKARSSRATDNDAREEKTAKHGAPQHDDDQEAGTEADGEAREELPAVVRYDDFVCCMTMRNAFIFMPTGEIWPGENLNARLPPAVVGQDANGKDIELKAAAWLRANRPVEQITWSPGDEQLITDKLLVENQGWIARPGARVYNQYKPPIIEFGDPALAGPWIDLVCRLYPDHCELIFDDFAHVVQRPQIKINHALALAGSQGTGKDTIVEAVKHAIGTWNAHTIDPPMLLGRFTGFAKSVLLHINEPRDLADNERSKLYNHLKKFAAAPPMTHRIDEKNVKEYFSPNVGLTVICTNYRTDWIFVPPDDRRLLVLWSQLTKEDFGATDEQRAAHWINFYHWYEHEGGYGHVAAWLRARDLSRYNPKAPPPKTEAFWELCNASRPEESSQLDDILDLMGRPTVTTIVDVIRAIDAEVGVHVASGFPFVGQPRDYDERQRTLNATRNWLTNREERPKLRHRFADARYHPVPNPAETKGRWFIRGHRQVVYGREGVNTQELLRHAQKLARS